MFSCTLLPFPISVQPGQPLPCLLIRTQNCSPTSHPPLVLLDSISKKEMGSAIEAASGGESLGLRDTLSLLVSIQ